jgi:hypothetical protein
MTPANGCPLSVTMSNARWAMLRNRASVMRPGYGEHGAAWTQYKYKQEHRMGSEGRGETPQHAPYACPTPGIAAFQADDTTQIHCALVKLMELDLRIREKARTDRAPIVDCECGAHVGIHQQPGADLAPRTGHSRGSIGSRGRPVICMTFEQATHARLSKQQLGKLPYDRAPTATYNLC